MTFGEFERFSPDRSDRENERLGVVFHRSSMGFEETISAMQVESALEWLEPRWAPLGWEAGRMTDHRQVAPGRKDDLDPVERDRLLAAIRGKFEPTAP